MKFVVWFGEVDNERRRIRRRQGCQPRRTDPRRHPRTLRLYRHLRGLLRVPGTRRPSPEDPGLLTGIDVRDSAVLQRVSDEIRALITSAEMPPETATEITRAYRQMKGLPVAVRSSATAENLAEASFAGQQSTFLNIVGEENVTRAVQECWASLFEAHAIYYRAGGGYGQLEVGIAVVVQYMVQSGAPASCLRSIPSTTALPRS